MSAVGEVFVRVRADSTGFKQEAAGPIASAGRDLSKVFLAAFAVGGIAKSIESVVGAATEHQSAFAVLGQATKDAGASNDLYGQSVESVLEKEARLKGFTDEELASGFQRLVAVTHDSKSAFTDLGAAEDLARFRHIDLATAALAVSKAEQGSVTALQRYGIVVPQVTTAQDKLTLAHQQAVAAGAKFTEGQKEEYDAALKTAKAADSQARSTEALALIQQRAGGAAQVFAQTTAGQFDRLQQDFHQFEVTVGTGLLSSLSGAAEGLGAFFTEASNSQRVRADIDALTGDIRTGFTDIKDVAETVGPVLLTVAGAAKDVVSAIGGPAILTAYATYQALGVVQTGLAAGQALYARAIAASTAATVTENSAVAATTGELVTLDAAAADVAATIATIPVELEAIGPAGAAGVGALQLEIAGLDTALTETQLRIDGLGAAFEALPAEAALGIGGVEAELTGLGATATVVAGEETAVGTAASAGGIAAFADGLVALVNPVTAVVAGTALLAGSIAYLYTRESDATRATHDLEGAVSSLSGALNDVPADALAVAEDKLALKRAQNVVATTKASHSSLEYKQDLLDVVSASQALDQALQTQHDHLAVVNADYDTAKQKASDARTAALFSAKATLPTYLGGPVNPELNFSESENERSATLFLETIQKTANSTKDLSPLLAHNFQLLEQFAEVYGKVPTQKQLNLIFDNKSATLTLQNFERELDGLPPLTDAAAARAGQAVTDNFNAAVLAGAARFPLGPSVSRDFSLLPSQAGPAAAAAGTTVGGIFGGALLAASATGVEAAANAAAAIQTEAEAQAKFEAATKPLREGITSDKQDLSQLATDMADAVTQGAQQLADAVQQAKANLNTIGQDLAQSLQQFIEKPLNDEQAKIAAAQNRLSLLGDKTTLQNLRGEVLLPGGKSLSQDPTKAIAQLQALEKTSKSPALQTFIQQYQAAALQEQSDGLATKQAVAQAIEQRASIRLANLTDLFNQGEISQQTLERDVTAVLRKQGLTEKTAKARGAAFADTVAGQLTGLGEQASAINAVPQAGSGLVPSIVRPIDTLNETQKSIAGIAKQQRDKQLDETKKQTQLLQKIHGAQAAAKVTGSLDHNPGTKTKRAVDLVGTGG